MPTAKSTSEAGNRTLLVKDGKGEFTIEVPKRYKITYSNFNPGTSADRYGNTSAKDATRTLRIYDGTKQVASFCGVTAFRDLALNFKRKVKIVDSKSESLTDSLGNVKAKQAVTIDEVLVDDQF